MEDQVTQSERGQDSGKMDQPDQKPQRECGTMSRACMGPSGDFKQAA